MRSIVNGFAVAVRRAPAWVAIAAVVLAGVLGSFAGQVEIATGNEGFAPDNPEIDAAERIADMFGGSQEAVFQVVLRHPGGDVISAEGLAVAAAVEEAIRSVGGGDVADTAERPGVVTYLAPVMQGAFAQGQDPAALDDEEVDALYTGALADLPPEQAGFLTGLLASGADASSARAESALILAFFRSDTVDSTEAFDEQIERDEALATALAGIDTGLEIRPFSFTLLFGEIDSFTDEVGRLFAFAGLIIVVILLFVYWLRARGSATVLQTSRRTVADMILTMVTILMAIGMMQGTGVLLEKAGIISAFSAPTQIVPILIIGLGVDYAIHLTSRYREEVGDRHSVDDSMTTAISTVGVALVLATMTTIIGFLTNVANPVPALTDFGILAAVGIFFSFLLMMTFVPAVRILMDRRAERKGRLPVDACRSHSQRILPHLMGRTAVIAERAPYAAIAIALVLGGLGYYGFTQLETRFSFTDFLPEDAPAVQTLEILTADFGGGYGEQTHILIEAPDGQTLATPAMHNALVSALDEIAGLATVSALQTESGPVANAASPVGVVGQLLAPAANPAPAEFLEVAAEVGVAQDLTVADDADIGVLYGAAASAAPEGWESVAHETGGRYDALLVDVRTTAGEDRVKALRADLAEAFAPVEATGARVVATSNNIIGDVVVEELTASQASSLFITVAAAALVLVVYFGVQARRPFLGIVTITPVALVVLWTYGLMYVTGVPFGPVTATLAALAIGIGVPFTIHMARRFEEDRVEHEDLGEAIRATATHTGGALAGSAFTTMAGFGILITSSLVPFKQMGQVTVFAIGLSLVASILLLPSLLVVWERWHRRRGHVAVSSRE